MSNGTPDHSTAPDAPWRDSPADSDAIPGSEEPDPADVVGEDGDERDLASPRQREPDNIYQHETLDERLAEEEPEAVLHGSPDAQAGEFQAPERGGDDRSPAKWTPTPTTTSTNWKLRMPPSTFVERADDADGAPRDLFSPVTTAARGLEGEGFPVGRARPPLPSARYPAPVQAAPGSRSVRTALVTINSPETMGGRLIGPTVRLFVSG
jgi:hypothetical protein